MDKFEISYVIEPNGKYLIRFCYTDSNLADYIYYSNLNELIPIMGALLNNNIKNYFIDYLKEINIKPKNI